MDRNKLKEKRKVQGLSQWALANLSGVSRQKITNFECGYSKLTKEESNKIELVFQIRDRKEDCNEEA